MGIIIKQCKGKVPGPSFILQAEYNADPAIETKSPTKRDKAPIPVTKQFTYT